MIVTKFNNGVWKIFCQETYQDLGWRWTKAEALTAIKNGPK